MAGFHDGLGAMSGIEGAFCCFLLVFVVEHSTVVLCVDLMMMHVLHVYCCSEGME